MFCYSLPLPALASGSGLRVLILAGTWFIAQPERVLLKERNFFGIAKVAEDAAGHYHILTHGSTIHGAQSLDRHSAGAPDVYHRSGPLGRFLRSLSGPRAKQEWRSSAWAPDYRLLRQAGQHFTFYEIDPAMERIAGTPILHVSVDCPAPVKVSLGDARLSLKDAPDSCYDMIILDAFSSDAIPIHLVTREAIHLYLAKLKPVGFWSSTPAIAIST